MTMIKKLGNTKVISDDGKEVRIQFRLDYIAYIENNHALYIGMIYRNSKSKTFIKIDAGFTNWLPPYAEELLTQSKKIEILDFLEKALKLLGYDYEIYNK